MRILLVEDNLELGKWLSQFLLTRNYAVDCVGDLEAARASLAAFQYDLAILDLGLPDGSGLDLLRNQRKGGLKCPVLILTAEDALQARVRGLDAGADDYLAKPFAIEELEARIRALIRRSKASPEPIVRYGLLEFDQITRTFRVAGNLLGLTPKEAAVLEKFVLNIGNVVSKSSLSDSLYGFGEDASTTAIEVYVHRVRKKLVPSNLTIVTLRGLGYVLRNS